jgi:hypothetical protein
MPGVMTLRMAREYQRQAEGGDLYGELSRGFEAVRSVRYAPRPSTKREAVAQFVDIAYAFAASVLSTPADYPAHVVDYATGLLNESLDYVTAEMRGSKNV